jgi:uncharacterized protein
VVDLLKAYFKKYKTAVVALSGGADSAAVLKLSCDFMGRENIISMTCSNSHIFSYEIENARLISSVLGIRWIPFNVEMSDGFYLNDENRCYYCKDSIMEYISSFKNKIKFDVVFDGTTIDDLCEVRPGFRAIKKFNVKSPLADNNKNKDFAEEICKFYKNKRIYFNDESCIATRIFEQGISKNILIKIERIEDCLRNNYKNIRVCFYPEFVKVKFKNTKSQLTENDKKHIEMTIKKYTDKKVIFENN